MSRTIAWIHDEMLSPDWVKPEQPAVFVFDEQWIREEQLSLKRIVFVYECLQAMISVEVRKGDVVAEVTDFCKEHNATGIETATSPLPRIKRQGAELGVTWIEPEPIAALPADVDLKRFSRYWRKAEKQVMRADA
ncbi:MAG: hypothetical protein AAGF31_04355 [Planctomycetota bacterium]